MIQDSVIQSIGYDKIKIAGKARTSPTINRSK